MPEEIFIIIIVGIAAGTFSGIVAQVIGYLKSRSPEPTTDSSMTTSELEGMIQKWIQEATRPLVKRLDRIEERLEPSSTELSMEKSILDDMGGYKAVEEKELISRKRTKAD